MVRETRNFRSVGVDHLDRSSLLEICHGDGKDVRSLRTENYFRKIPFLIPEANHVLSF